jgi:hypothetical protein
MRSGRVHVLGRVLNDPRLYFTPSGETVARFELGTAFYGPPALGEAVSRHRCLAWNRGERKLADVVVENLQRGATVYVEGRPQGVHAVALQRVGDRWHVVVRDVQLVEGVREWGGHKFEASSASPVGVR